MREINLLDLAGVLNLVGEQLEMAAQPLEAGALVGKFDLAAETGLHLFLAVLVKQILNFHASQTGCRIVIEFGDVLEAAILVVELARIQKC